ncbi:MAG: hypothetical protein Alpg2KO_01100 [Alphaproteobacteria bacterium]
MTDQTKHDPGGKVRHKLPDGVTGAAEFSPCERYRWWLSRKGLLSGQKPLTRPQKGSVLWIGMNPSTADATVNDPTCTREMNFTRRLGYDRYIKTNMLGWRATKPADLPADPREAQGIANLWHITELAAQPDTMIILAFGKLPARYRPVIKDTLKALHKITPTFWCLGQNKDGTAKHPLYLAADTPLQRFDLGLIARKGRAA